MKSDTLYNMAREQYESGRYTQGKLLNALGYIVEVAESENKRVYFAEGLHGERKGIIICDINELCGMQSKLGTDFNPEYMLNGMQAVTQDENGYCMSVLTTHDLYSAEIPDISEVVYRIRQL